MFIPRDRHEEVKAIAKAAAEKVVIDAPDEADTTIGPVVSAVRFDRIFVPGPRAGTQTDFSHSGVAVVTVPTGQERIPPAFVQALLQQFSMLDLSGADELTRILHG